MKKQEIEGYKLIKPEYDKAASKIAGLYTQISDIKSEIDFKHGSSVYERLKKQVCWSYGSNQYMLLQKKP